ncbi:MAG: HEAT repeat domain-containing protein [Planctomycetes bacterium]|nr:HEAT repeat domain-containing protein [Planctomycetota bacterium]
MPRLPPPTGATTGGWWEANLDALTDGEGLAPVTTGDAGALERARTVVREGRIVPFLRRVVRGELGLDADLVGAGTIALAKATSDPEDVERLLAVATDGTRPALVQETSAIAPGLLRRTDPKAQFPGRLLDRVRARLLDVFDGRTNATRRARHLAALALGLLGDQPGASDGGATPRVDVVAALLTRLRESDDPEAQAVLAVALGLQARTSFDAASLAALRGLAADGVLASRERVPAVQAHAMVALARVVGDEASGLLLGHVRARSVPNEVRHGALVALAAAGPRLAPVARTAAATEVAAHAEGGNPETVSLALLSLGRLCADAMRDPADRTTLAAPAAALLVRQVDAGAGPLRGVAALSLGFALRPPAPPDVDGGRAAFRATALPALVAAFEGVSDPEVRGAAIVALGLARDHASFPRLATLLARRDVDVAMRARAATAIGLLREGNVAALDALHAALDPSSPEPVRREAARALGYLSDPRVVPVLVADLRGENPDFVRSRAAVALGAFRRATAVDALLELAADPTAGDPARANAVAALGILADPERVRSLGRLATDLSGAIVPAALGQALAYL